MLGAEGVWWVKGTRFRPCMALNGGAKLERLALHRGKQRARAASAALAHAISSPVLAFWCSVVLGDEFR